MTSPAALFFVSAMVIAPAAAAQDASRPPATPPQAPTVRPAAPTEQDASVRATRNTFGVPDTTTYRHVLSVDAAGSVGYDTFAMLQSNDGRPSVVTAPTHPKARLYDMASGGLSYALNTDRVDLGASISSALRHYPRFSQFKSISHSGSVGAAVMLGDRTRIGGTQTISVQPLLLFRPSAPLLPAGLGQVAAPDVDFGAGFTGYRSYITTAEVTHSWSKTSFSGSYGRHVAEFSSIDGEYDSNVGAVRLTRGLTRSFGLRLGYGYTETRYRGEAGATTFRNHTLDVGAEFNRALSLTRRTRISFAMGTAFLDEYQRRRFEITGTAKLIRDIGRTWHAVVSYGRNTGFYETVRAPFFYDGVDAALVGTIARHIFFRAGAGAFFGDLATPSGGGANGFDTWYGSSGIGIPLSRHLALEVDYLYYGSRFTGSVLVVPGAAPELSRHSVRASLRTQVPLLQIGRRERAAR